MYSRCLLQCACISIYRVTYCHGINTKQFIGLTHNFFPTFYGQRLNKAVLVFFRPVQNMTEENQHSLVKTLSIKFGNKL